MFSKARIAGWSFLRSSVCLSVMASCGIAAAAPLEPIQTTVNVHIDGHARVIADSPTPHETGYDLSGSGGAFSESGTWISSNVTTGETPGFGHRADAGSSAGVQFEQIADNEYVLTLSSTARGDLIKGDDPLFHEGEFQSHSALDVSAHLAVLGLPGQPAGTPSTVYLTLEHYGTLSEVNNGLAQTQAHVSVESPGGSPPLNYFSQLVTPTFPTGNFQQHEFTGTRDVLTEYVISTFTGKDIDISASLTSAAMGGFDETMPIHTMSADSDFDSGVRLHMLVMPEPAALSLIGMGLLLVFRRQRTAV